MLDINRQVPQERIEKYHPPTQQQRTTNVVLRQLPVEEAEEKCNKFSILLPFFYDFTNPKREREAE